MSKRPDDMFSWTSCKCGHELGDHRANTLRQCGVASCACEKFRAAPAQETGAAP